LFVVIIKLLFIHKLGFELYEIKSFLLLHATWYQLSLVYEQAMILLVLNRYCLFIWFFLFKRDSRLHLSPITSVPTRCRSSLWNDCLHFWHNGTCIDVNSLWWLILVYAAIGLFVRSRNGKGRAEVLIYLRDAIFWDFQW